MPPGRMSNSAMHQQFDITVLAISAAPVIIAVLLYFIYSIVVWRARPGDDGDGAPIYGNIKVQAAWIVGTTVIVLWLFVFGTVELVVPHGAGAGEGPSPIWTPAGVTSAIWTPGGNKVLQVQVIGQQWTFTYRYPQFGGMESTELMLPVNTEVTFHVTSLDVIHSFWAYQLGVKADANPQVDNVAFATPQSLGSVIVRCSELCGIWHGAMFNYGHVVTQSAFQSWASGVQATEQSRRGARRAAAVCAHLRSHRDPAARQEPGQGGRDHRARRATTTRPLTRCSHDALRAADSGVGNVRHDLGEGVTGWPSRHSRSEPSLRAVVLRSAGGGACGHGGCVRERISA